ncbi:MAG: histidine--tRNA ligase [Luteitalea sp.]|nr:histidine--tRNA ligase [Luteitalea sp.]
MSQAGTKPPSGTRDFLPDEIRRREHVVRIVREVYESHGFEPLETPAFENIETLLGKYGEEGNKLIFKILRRGEHEAGGEADLALRYDLTVPLARVVAQYQNDLPRFFKRYQIQPVWRADRPARGRFREFYQCDIDAIGSTSPVVEAELLAAVSQVLARLGFDDFVIRLNHRGALTAMLQCAGIPESQHADALVSLDKLAKIGPEGVEADMRGRGIDAAATLTCLGFLNGIRRDDPHDAGPIERFGDFVRSHHAGPAAVSELDQILRLSDGTPAHGRIRIDPSLARGLSYYTGAIMEIAVPDLPGSLGGGGRYDNLVGMFLGRDVAACGFSLGLERIIVVMSERGMFPARVSRAAVDVMVTFLSDELRADALKLAAELRAEKLRVEVYPEVSRRFDKPLKYASSRNVPVLAIIGEDEHARGEVAVRDLQTRQQEAAPRDTAASWIAARVRIDR